MIVREHIKDFSLKHTFECGQCFRWDRQPDGSYVGIAGGRAAKISFRPVGGEYEGTLTIENGRLEVNTEEDNAEYREFWQDYLDMNRDYGEIKKRITGCDPVMEEVIEAGAGMRILKQDPWEALVSFIISQNNNISRIKSCIDNLCRAYGEPLGVFEGRERFAFPAPEILAALEPEDLDPIRLGYRAKYIVETARAVMKEGVQKLYDLQRDHPDEGYRYLCSLPGVGPKVANCIMLFGLGQMCCFPVDVWIRRIMSELYGIPEQNLKAIEDFGNEKFGEYSGIAQQYLFYYVSKVRDKKQGK